MEVSTVLGDRRTMAQKPNSIASPHNRLFHRTNIHCWILLIPFGGWKGQNVGADNKPSKFSAVLSTSVASSGTVESNRFIVREKATQNATANISK